MKKSFNQVYKLSPSALNLFKKCKKLYPITPVITETGAEKLIKIIKKKIVSFIDISIGISFLIVFLSF